jgi:hypothetical protein
MIRSTEELLQPLLVPEPEAARLLSMTGPALAARRRRGIEPKIPFLQRALGSPVFYSTDALRKWVEENQKTV